MKIPEEPFLHFHFPLIFGISNFLNRLYSIYQPVSIQNIRIDTRSPIEMQRASFSLFPSNYCNTLLAQQISF